MDGTDILEKKLKQFTNKYYKSELIKGTILFFSFGCLYLFFTVFIEYFLWLKPTPRTFLFWFFILIEAFLLIRYVFIPISKLLGIRNGITNKQASKIIGNHFPEVKDKLLNVIQLKENINQSDLLLASIQQKTSELEIVPFTKAIDFNQNKKYLKYAILPIIILLIYSISGINNNVSNSLDRIVNHRTAYTPPAPFSFYLQNSNLKVIQGKSITVFVETKGNILPAESKIYYNQQEYYLQNNGNGLFSYTFSDVQKPISFYIKANEIESKKFDIEIINTPTINNISLDIVYPNYLKKRNETINNSGNIIVPEGTYITWNANTHQTDSLKFIINKNVNYFNRVSKNKFSYSKKLLNSINYKISSSNESLINFENLQFSVDVIKDEKPTIKVESNIDSVSRGTVFFAGKISDDYGINKLQIIYYDVDNSEEKQSFDLTISNQNIQTFFYEFPNGLNVKKGINYEIYFQVSDNDIVNGNKIAKSKIFKYRQKIKEEIQDDLLNEQRKTISKIESSIQNQQKQQQSFQKIQKELQVKKKANWNDKKKITKFLERQKSYNKMMQRQTEKLQQNLEEKKELNENLQNKKEELKKRIEELKKLDKQQKLLDEIKKVAEKINKDEIIKKTKELAQQNIQQQRSLERILELTKRFYVEQKTMQIANKIEKLSKKQDDLSKKNANDLKAQEEIKEEFIKIKEELQELDKDNEKLKEPMELPDVEDEKQDVDTELNKSEKNLASDKQKEAKKNQKNSSKKMKEMSAKMQKVMMEMEGDSIEENMDDLRKILENVLTFSFKQEKLMNKFDELSTSHPDFGKDLKRQNQLKTYFEHIDDSLYVLSMRLPKISSKIKDDLSNTHYNLDESLENFSENRFSKGITNQRYVMTSVNNLADYLSNMLDAMMNPSSMKMGKGKKGKGQGFSLPDLIKKQGELSQKMKKGMKKGDKPGDKKGEGKKGENGKDSNNGKKGKSGEKGENGKKGKDGKRGENGNKSGEGEGSSNDDLDGEIYQIYKEQSLLRQALEEQIKKTESGGNGMNLDARKALKEMQELENEILEKGFNVGSLNKMQNLNYQLLKLDKATLEQGEENKRKANTNTIESQKKKIKEIIFKKQFYNQTEILNRQSLPLQQNYKKKVRAYFSDTKKE